MKHNLKSREKLNFSQRFIPKVQKISLCNSLANETKTRFLKTKCLDFLLEFQSSQIMNLVLTGSTSGIGWETLKALLPDFERIFLPVRNMEKAEKKIALLSGREKIKLIQMDLSDMKSVKSGAKEILQSTDQIDVLINNAGGMFPAGKITADGLDMTFATNHLGHFLLTKELLPALKKGKAKMKQFGSVNIPQKAFISVLRSDND